MGQTFIQEMAAAFGRLCVETHQQDIPIIYIIRTAAFGRLCVETRIDTGRINNKQQPPSGGCVLKLMGCQSSMPPLPTAAFGRLCVETPIKKPRLESTGQPPSGGCVLKQPLTNYQAMFRRQPPSGGCVLKQIIDFVQFGHLNDSRLRAAVC